MIKIKYRKKAFSLLELSVSLIIVSVLVVGVVSGSRLINASKLSQAQALTKSSAITSIPDLTLWMETTLNDSITGATSGSSLSNDDLVSSWNDLSGNSVNVTQATGSYQPKYITAGINNLPTLSFDGGNDYLYNTSKVPLQPGDDSFTFVAVWKRIGGVSLGAIFEQNTNGSTLQGRRASLLTISTSQYGFNGESNDFHSNNYTTGASIITVMTLTAPTGAGSTIAVNIYNSSNNVTYSGTISASIENVANNVFMVGAKAVTTRSDFFPGYISEIMVFDRDLNPSEVSLINNYLSKKYNITVS